MRNTAGGRSGVGTALVFVFLVVASSAQTTPQLTPYLQSASQALNEACSLVQQRWNLPLNQIQGYDTNECFEVPGCNSKQFLPTGWACNATYGFGISGGCNCNALEISRDAAITMTPQNASDPELIKRTKCRFATLGIDFSKIASKYGLISLFTGFQSGVHISWPARDWGAEADPARNGCRVNFGRCQAFEPRFRNWYVAASAGPKNVILVLDFSGSMAQNGRVDIAKAAGKAVLDTLTFADFVSVISFSSFASVVAGFPPSLVRATQSNLDLLRIGIDGLIAQGATNFEEAFNLAFQILSGPNKGSNCQNMILFMTDGTITEGFTIDKLMPHLKTLNTPAIDARIFTYALGSEAAPAAPKAIACAHKGVFAAVPDRGDLRTKMGQYYQYLAAGAIRNQAVWSEPYIDCCGMGNITSISLPCYSGENPPQLIGVAGSSVPFSFLGSARLEDLLAPSTVCKQLQLTESDIETIRGSERCGADPVALGVGLGVGLGVPVLIAIVMIIVCIAAKRRRQAAAQPRAASEPAEVVAAREAEARVASARLEPVNEPSFATKKKKKKNKKSESSTDSDSSDSSSSVAKPKQTKSATPKRKPEKVESSSSSSDSESSDSSSSSSSEAKKKSKKKEKAKSKDVKAPKRKVETSSDSSSEESSDSSSEISDSDDIKKPPKKAKSPKKAKPKKKADSSSSDSSDSDSSDSKGSKSSGKAPRVAVIKKPGPSDHVATDISESVDASEKRSECKICMDRPIKTVFVPCGHRATCKECADEITKKRKAECPICRQQITQAVETFDA